MTMDRGTPQGVDRGRPAPAAREEAARMGVGGETVRAEVTRAALCYIATAVAFDGFGPVQLRGQDNVRLWPWAEDAWQMPMTADAARAEARRLLDSIAELT